MLRSSLVMLLCLAGLSAHAKSFESVGDKQMSVKLGLSIPTFNMAIRPTTSANLESLEYVPHARTFTYLSVAYDWWGFSVSSANPTEDSEDRLKGSTEGRDWQFRFNFEKTSYEFFYQTYKGYYLSQHEVAFPRGANDPYLQFPDLRTEHFGANFIYNWNPTDFSLTAVMDQNERQTQSSWAWLLGASVHGMRFANPTSFVPPNVVGNFPELDQVRSGRLYSVLAGAGVGGVWVPFDRFFLAGVAMTYYGMEMQKIESTGGDINYSGTTTKTHVKMSMGYNGDRWISGFAANTDAAKYNIRGTEIDFTNILVQMYVGRRFDL